MYVFIHNFDEFYTSKKEELNAEYDPIMQDIL